MADTIEQQAYKLVKRFFDEIFETKSGQLEDMSPFRKAKQCAILHCKLHLKSFPPAKGTHAELEGYIQDEIAHYTALVTAIKQLK